MSVARRNRQIHFLTGKTYNALHDLIQNLPMDDSDPIPTRLMFDDCRFKLIEALRACQRLYVAVAPPVSRSVSPCPCANCRAGGADCDTPPRAPAPARLTGEPADLEAGPIPVLVVRETGTHLE
jgi:hypothetical protein